MASLIVLLALGNKCLNMILYTAFYQMNVNLPALLFINRKSHESISWKNSGEFYCHLQLQCKINFDGMKVSKLGNFE